MAKPKPSARLGVSNLLGPDALQQLPESDRTGQVIIARTETAMQIGSTNDTGDLLADEIEYNGDRFKILQLKNWGRVGEYAAIATRIGKVATVVPPPDPEGPEDPEEPGDPIDIPARHLLTKLQLTKEGE